MHARRNRTRFEIDDNYAGEKVAVTSNLFTQSLNYMVQLNFLFVSIRLKETLNDIKIYITNTFGFSVCLEIGDKVGKHKY